MNKKQEPQQYKDFFTLLAEEEGGQPRPQLVQVPLEAIEIDPHAPRQVLPDDLQQRLLAGEIEGPEAMAALLQRAEAGDAVATLILEGPAEGAGGLRGLAESIRQVGLRQPLTGYLVERAGRPRCRLGEGQRRYWAHHLLVQEGHEQFRTVWVVTEPWPGDALRVLEGQLAENMARQPLSDVALARGMARVRQLLVTKLNLEVVDEEGR